MSPEAWLPVALIIGYLLGSIPFGLILTKLAGTQDLRSIGSGNIGATNVLRTGRKGLAAATLLGDVLKGTVAVVIAGYFGGPNAAMLAALGAFLGHLFPVWLKFKGGKGVAIYIGVLIGLFWPAAVVFCVLWLATAVDHALLVAVGAGREFRHADLPVVVRPPRAGLAVRRADPAAVLRAPRKHQAVAGGHRRADRGEVTTLPIVSVGKRSMPPNRADPMSNCALSARSLCPPDDDLSVRFSASSTNRAAASAPASSPNRAITCTPTGNPPSAT